MNKLVLITLMVLNFAGTAMASDAVLSTEPAYIRVLNELIEGNSVEFLKFHNKKNLYIVSRLNSDSSGEYNIIKIDLTNVYSIVLDKDNNYDVVSGFIIKCRKQPCVFNLKVSAVQFGQYLNEQLLKPNREKTAYYAPYPYQLYTFEIPETHNYEAYEAHHFLTEMNLLAKTHMLKSGS